MKLVDACPFCGQPPEARKLVNDIHQRLYVSCLTKDCIVRYAGWVLIDDWIKRKRYNG